MIIVTEVNDLRWGEVVRNNGGSCILMITESGTQNQRSGKLGFQLNNDSWGSANTQKQCGDKMLQHNCDSGNKS